MPLNKQEVHIYRRFSEAPGNQHIASEHAIKKLLELVEKFDVKDVLEVGLGIGSIAGVLLTMNKTNLHYVGTEANEFCLKALPINLERQYQRLTIMKHLMEIPQDQKFDLVIIDGKDSGLEIVKKVLKPNGILAIEGDRMYQQEFLEKLFPVYNYVHSISRHRNNSYSPFPSDHWQGGLKIYFINPTLKQKLWLLREKVATKLKYLIFR